MLQLYKQLKLEKLQLLPEAAVLLPPAYFHPHTVPFLALVQMVMLLHVEQAQIANPS